jgi:arylsulfatase A-like enzyme/predicted Zn-dependent protease
MSRKRRPARPVSARPASAGRHHRLAGGRIWASAGLLAMALVVGGAVWWWAAGRPAESGSAPLAAKRHMNVLLITADTVGADQLGTYGNRVIATPHLDALARSGILFENASTVAPLTLPAHTSILTGSYPMAHGVRDNGIFYARREQATLATTLKNAGYATGAFVGAFVLDSRWGLDRGFDRYVDDFDLSEATLISPDMVRHRGETVVANARRWLDEVKGGPFLAWVHLFDPHAPYDPPEPYRGKYGTAPWGLYHAEVAHVDNLVGQLLDWLAQNGLDETTTVVFAGDHGESLGRHGETSHGFFVYDATIRVPFILRAPNHPAGRRVAAQVSSIDLMPTVLDALQVPTPSSVQGRSLLGLAAGHGAETGLEAYSETYNPRYEYGWSELKSLRTESFHFIDAPRPELYDVQADPAEQHDLASQRADLVGRYKRVLNGLVARASVESDRESGAGPIDVRTRERLAALGYVSGAVRADNSRAPVDPKDKIALVNLIKEAGADLKSDRLDAAFERIRTVLAADSDILAAYNVLGNLHVKNGDRAKALQAFQQALAKDPKYRPALFNVAVLYHDLNRPRDAADTLQRLLALDPRDSDVLLKLGQAALDARDAAKAQTFFDQVLAVNPDSGDAEAGLGSTALLRDDLATAQRHFTRASNLQPTAEDVHYNLGVVHHRRGDLARAEAEYRRETQAHPDNVKAHHYLGLLYAQQNNFDGQLEAFQTVVRLNPNSAQANFLLADALFQKERVKEALPLIRRAIALDPKDEQPYLLLAAIEEKLGNDSGKERALAEARARKRLRGS